MTRSFAALVALLSVAAPAFGADTPATGERLSASPPVEALQAGRVATTREVALAFIDMAYRQGEFRKAYDTFAAEDMIQHNPTIADGLAAHRAYFADLESRIGSTADWANLNNMIIVDGDHFALHHLVFTGPGDSGRAFVDIWRVEDGRIVEHWDVIQPIAQDMPHDNGMGCGVADSYEEVMALGQAASLPACGFPDPAASREASLAALDAYSAMLISGDVAGAIEGFLTDDYRQHSPVIADGRDGALEFLLDEFGKGDAAMPEMGPMRIVAEGDLVLMHRLTRYSDGSRTANIDIFKLREGQISEHWDLKQPIPDQSANENGMW